MFFFGGGVQFLPIFSHSPNKLSLNLNLSISLYFGTALSVMSVPVFLWVRIPNRNSLKAFRNPLTEVTVGFLPEASHNRLLELRPIPPFCRLALTHVVF